MPSTEPQVELPAGVLRVMGRLERWTGRLSLQRAMFNLIALGLLLTALVMGVVWWAEQHRRDQALESASARLRDLVQSQLDHKLALVNQIGRAHV